MTNDKGAVGQMQAQAGICQRCFDDHEGNDCVGYARSQSFIAGRKAERERCAQIAETETAKYDANGFISQKWIMCSEIAEKIRGGQDGK